MPSLIGNKINQVPSNGDLGTLAFQDSNAVNITGGVVDVSAGTAALPTLGTTGDPNTGVFFPAADTVAVATNGVERVRVDSAGNLGVGTTSPTQKLEISSGSPVAKLTGTTGNSIFWANNTGGTLYVGIDTSTGGTFGNGNYSRAIYSSGAYPLDFYTNDALRMRIDASGNVGVGTTSPAYLLDVKGQTRFGVNSATGMGMQAKYVGSPVFGTNLYFGADNGTAQNGFYIGSANAGGAKSPIIFSQASNTNAYGADLSALTYVEAMRINSSGGVSIGNTTDRGAASLNVSGLIYPQQAATAPTYVKGAIYFDTTLNKLRVGGATGWETITSV